MKSNSHFHLPVVTPVVGGQIALLVILAVIINAGTIAKFIEVWTQ